MWLIISLLDQVPLEEVPFHVTFESRSWWNKCRCWGRVSLKNHPRMTNIIANRVNVYACTKTMTLLLLCYDWIIFKKSNTIVGANFFIIYLYLGCGLTAGLFIPFFCFNWGMRWPYLTLTLTSLCNITLGARLDCSNTTCSILSYFSG